MTFNTQQFINEAKKKGVPNDQINKYLKSKGIVTPQNKPTQEGKASGGFLGYVAAAVSTLPQAIGLGVGAPKNTKTVEGLSSTLQSQSDNAIKILKQIQIEKDPTKKERLKMGLKDIASNSKQIADLMNELASGKGLEEATELKLAGGWLLDAPGLSTDAKRATQQIAGRSISQLGASASPVLGATGAGAFVGAGRGIEAGKDTMGVATETLAYAAGAKLFSFGSDKLANTQVGQRILSAPIGSTVLKVGNKVFSPFLATPAEQGTFGAVVDTTFKNFGNAAEKLFSPSAYLRQTGKVFETIGETTGLRGKPEERLLGAQKKITNYWEGVKNKYKSLVQHDTNSPEILGREGIIPEGRGGTMVTKDQVDLVNSKGAMEHSYLNKMLDESRLYASVSKYRNFAINQINQNFQGVERQAALRAFNNQYNAVLKDHTSQIIDGVDGQRIPLKILNNMKSYMWSEGYGPKLIKSDALYAKSMRIAGNAAKNYIDSVARAESGELADTIMQLNQHSGELFQAAKFLNSLNGSKLPFGQIGRYFAQTVGAIIGSGAGPLGSASGMLTANQIVNILQNPKVSVGKAAILVSQLQKQNPKIVEQALSMIKEMAIKQASMKMLTGKQVPNVINLPDIGVLKGQQKIK